MEVFTFVNKWLGRKDVQGLSFKAWSMCRESQLLTLPSSFTKKLGGAFEHDFAQGTGV